ncbi:MAG: cation:proton antiporter [Myxococcales bacterium]
MHELDIVKDLAVVLFFAGMAAWACQRLGVSVVVGYLVAGILIGPFTPPAAFVNSVESVHRLANLGLVFVMFFVGLELSITRLRALGLPAVAVTLATAMLVLASARFTAGALGLGVSGGLFLGGILVVSSSAIIDKVFRELDVSREPYARLALGITVLEDIVAVVMLALLGSVAAASADQAVPLGRILGMMAAFVLLALVLALLVVPRLLRALRRSASPDVQVVVVAAVLLLAAWVASSAGYSVALGAFLLGSSLGGTQHKPHLEHSLAPLRDIFAAVFFVSMGMLFDVRLVVSEWPWVLALTAFAMATRGLAAFAGLTLVGQPLGHAAQVALALLPLGEFSFVIAQLGTSSGLMPPAFYPATVGAALITTLLSPPLIRRGPAVARWLSAHEPSLSRAWHTFLERAGEALRRRGGRKPLLKLIGGRVLQLGIEAAVVVGAVASSRLVLASLDAVAQGHPIHPWLPLLFWVGFGVVLLVPLLALWRGLGALGMLLGEAVTEGLGAGARLVPVVERAVQVAGSLALLLLCTTFLPGWALQPWVLLTILVAGFGLALLLRPLLVRWYAQAQTELRGNLATAPAAPSPLGEARTRSILGAPFGLKVHEHVLSDLSPAAGQTVGATELRRRSGSTIVGIDRQGITLTAPGAETRLFPNDRLLLVGTTEQIDQAERWLASEAPQKPEGAYQELLTGLVPVPAGAPFAGTTIRDLAVASRFGVQVLGRMRDGQSVNGGGELDVQPGDVLFVLGTASQNRAFAEWLARPEKPEPPGASPTASEP